MLFVMIRALAARGGGESGNAAPAATEPPAATEAMASSEESRPDSSGDAMMEEPEFKIQLGCINRTGNPCTLIYPTEEEHGIDAFIERVKDRTNGRVVFPVSSFPELGLDGPDSLRLFKDQTMEIAEIYSGYLGGDLPIIDVAKLWGLFLDEATNFAVIDATRSDLHRIIEEQSNGIVIMGNYYESNYSFSSWPLKTLEDFEGPQTRSHSTVLSDLLDGMGADAQSLASADVYTALERGVQDAAVSCGTCGSSVRWYEVTDYMVGPIFAISVSWITITKDVREPSPPDLQAFIREERERRQGTSRVWVENVGAQEGINENAEGGMEYVQFTSEFRNLYSRPDATTCCRSGLSGSVARTARQSRSATGKLPRLSASAWEPTTRLATSTDRHQFRTGMNPTDSRHHDGSLHVYSC